MKERQKAFIAVMGVTGSGKSTFIQTATGSDDVHIGHSFKSCTAAVSAHTLSLDEYDVTLIDTPGFNDTFRSETEVLKEIANWLDYTYRNPPHVMLTGIIYMQSITDRRMYGSTLRNLKMFRQLCGESPLRNVVFTTTGWGTAEKSGELSKALENQESLRSDPDFWEPMIRRGSTMAKFEDTKASALAIIMSIVERNPILLKIQEELVDENKNLIDTAAGHTVNEEMKRLEEKYTQDIAKVQKDMEEALAARDTEYHAALQEAKENYERLRDEAQRARDSLQYERRNEKRRLTNEIEGMKRQLERDKKKHEEYLELKFKAQQINEEMKYEEIVRKLRANGHLLRDEERQVLEMKIQELEAASVNGGNAVNGNGKKKKGKGTKLLIGLAQVLGSVTMGLLGFPMLFGDPIGTLASIF
ncbi:hypothetical protein H112_02992 [Trichophyton rubrum D6]|uniref:AIG1-type G domain-containing protein n=5 Tax=Trichophyton TaxID=5550 RepID=A0A178EWE6_TRIRU|nr:uncharacterized protein TERG_05617 [Trichophyton rubrum CBS 118892]EZF24500.1 hypothetical protein H100_02996 [Trichophyton rubrum MR850]EZF43548.1 hypothetical protein H102_02990 [Trichophyton rubrum CBS 100081]EZF54200.1 hypothetical protein H103_03004 [Trichophyton rubrum CBS 288.86]EZF64817.1 hypothetical protein H104_02984 [Trichophyton rubrum CBS 289.86]EZF75423.1 hypothetical protein H105_03010 [Trichophyton soudanense CBS 452.61]EZF86040.1 hypothetical protein H110_02998 [Trichophy